MLNSYIHENTKYNIIEFLYLILQLFHNIMVMVKSEAPIRSHTL